MDPNNFENYFVEFESKFKKFRLLPFPKITIDNKALENLVDFISDIQIDIAEEDGYLAGLVEKFLSKKHLIVEDKILIDKSIDVKLDLVMKKIDEIEKNIAEIQSYRKAMLDIATSLSKISGIPINHG